MTIETKAGSPTCCNKATIMQSTGIVINNNQATNCAKCLKESSDDEEDDCRVCFKCKHHYHRLCIDQWLAKETRCPLCHPRLRTAYNETVCQVLQGACMASKVATLHHRFVKEKKNYTQYCN
ncbi:RING-H2 finger protein ATL48-like [Durio zibethinus]|uniref:RING-type E3 ubiquitin transferase n=1 Tax=Durio zibethinus TaxID=66656 RepID=A0A6P5YMM6_DURZI|nr:RING-H2 finger protein ATL48-like [Durio zibethinus]